MKRYRLAIIGCGGVSQMHFDGYAGHPERVQVVAGCDPSAEAVRRRQEQYGFAGAFESVERLLAEEEFDVAVICTPTPVREAVLHTLAAAGKPIYCEKPLADTLEEARRMVRACERGGVPLAVDQNFRLHYPFEQAREILNAGLLGRPLHVIHRDLMFRQDRGWRAGCDRHALSVMGVHWLDGFRVMLGDEAVSVLCHTRSSPAVECAGETEAALLLAFGRGTVVSYVQSFASAFRATDTLVVGERGTLRLDDAGVARYENAPGREPVETWANPYRGAGPKAESCFAGLEALLAAMEAGTEAPNSGRDNLKTIALLDAAYRSAAEGRIIPLKEGLPA